MLKRRIGALLLTACLTISGMQVNEAVYAKPQTGDMKKIHFNTENESNADVGINGFSTTLLAETLGVPANIRWDNTTAKWDYVSNANFYCVTLYKVENRKYTEIFNDYTSLNYCNLNYQLKNNFGPGQYAFDVYAMLSLSDTSSVHSVKSGIYEYNAVRLDTPEDLKWNGKAAEWKAVNNAEHYNVCLYKNGNEIKSLRTVGNETYLDLNEEISLEGAGEYTFEVYAVPANDGEYCISSVSKRSEVLNNTEEFVGVEIGNVRVTNKNCNDVLGDGKVKYALDTNTLTLKNVNLIKANDEDNYSHYGIIAQENLTIIVEGTNTITIKSGKDVGEAIHCNGKLNILGTGTLNAKVTGEAYYYSYGIYAFDDIYIGGNVKIAATASDVSYDESCSWEKSCGIYSERRLTVGTAAVVTGVSGQMKNSQYACGITAYVDITISGSAIVTAVGQQKAFLTNNINCGNLPIKVNTNAMEKGAFDWNNSDKLGGGDSTFKYVKIGSEEMHAHNNGVLVKGTPATLTKNGSKTYYKCHCGKLFEDSKCTKVINGDINKWKVVAYPKNIALDKTIYTYTGKTITPKVKITDSNGKTIADSNYTVTYSKDRKSVGEYKVTVKFKGNYSGTKVLTFKINPKGTKLNVPKSAKKGFTIKWKKVSLKMAKSRISGYQIQYAKSAKFKGAKKKNIKGYKKTGVTVTKIAARKKYYVRVRTYIKVSGKTYYSAWSKAKKVKTK